MKKRKDIKIEHLIKHSFICFILEIFLGVYMLYKFKVGSQTIRSRPPKPRLAHETKINQFLQITIYRDFWDIYKIGFNIFCYLSNRKRHSIFKNSQYPILPFIQFCLLLGHNHRIIYTLISYHN